MPGSGLNAPKDFASILPAELLSAEVEVGVTYTLHVRKLK